MNNNQYGDIKILDRKKISLTGVRKVINFNSEEFLIETSLGILSLKGSELEIMKLDTSEQLLSVKGQINSLIYMDSNKKEVSFISRLFK